MDENKRPLIEVKNLTKIYDGQKGWLGKKQLPYKAVQNVSLALYAGETLGVVGESGCGKSTLGKMMVKLLAPTEGEILFEGQNITNYNDRSMLALRKDIQMIFQDPFGALNPWMNIGQLIAEPLEIHKIVAQAEIKQRVEYLLDKVGLGQYEYDRYPHQFSGGQRQRICIARALATKPKFILCDEPVSALDVSIQSQILNLLIDLQREFNLTYMFISHSLSVIRNIADRVAVMYLGKIVEISPVEDFFQTPLHPYARLLLEAIPIPDPDHKRKSIIGQGEIEQQSSQSGCYFYPRCPQRQGLCQEKEPFLQEIKANHWVACHKYDSKQ